jgi:hypothetical protein
LTPPGAPRFAVAHRDCPATFNADPVYADPIDHDKVKKSHPKVAFEVATPEAWRF